MTETAKMWHALNRRQLKRLDKFSVLLLLCLVAFILYFIFINELVYTYLCYTTSSSHHKNSFDQETWINLSKYQVYNKKCHMLSMNPYDPSILPFVTDEKFESCSSEPRLSSIFRKSNGNLYLIIDEKAAKQYKNISCCYALIMRPEGNEADKNIRVGTCQHFERNMLLNKSVEVVYVSCTAKVTTKSKMKITSKVNKVYENVHAVINPERIKQNPNASISTLLQNNTKTTHQRPLSVLMLGLDSVSRLNFYRTMPLTRTYFRKRGWAELRAYNKMGDNTLPNFMAILTGQNETLAKKCHEKMPHTMGNCSMIWRKFKEAGYATAFAEDETPLSTFNYAVGGFVEPPTDYYLRPYVLASEKLLKVRGRFRSKYCTGSELSADRIFDVAMDFSRNFINSPYFGLFWTNTISHNYLNAPSAYDSRFIDKLQDLESYGVMNDTMVIVFSDHGMRFGGSRETFIGWYEERLPFVYIWLPPWFRKQNPHSYEALLSNQDRLTSPYDMYETLRDILQRAGGQAPASSGCPSCSSLFKPVPFERGCRDAGISPHWCTCTDFEPFDETDPIALEGAEKFIDYINSVIENYKDEYGTRLWSKLTLKRMMRVQKLIDLDEDPHGEVLKLFYQLELTPGGGKFQTTVSYREPGRYIIKAEEVSRINLYGHSAKCLEKGFRASGSLIVNLGITMYLRPYVLATEKLLFINSLYTVISSGLTPLAIII